ncbi:MAG: transposase [Chloroflexi bacterium]|nr:transposase [Chloroflexota bacterium]
MIFPAGSIHPEVLFGAGYAILLVAAAFGLEWMARGAYRRSESYELNGFMYHRDLDVWECPTGQHLTPTAVDQLQQIIQYRARPAACNGCPLKSQCTDSDEGREIVQSQAPWPHSEVARFHRGLSLLLLGMAGFAIAVVAVRNPTGVELGVLGGPAVLVLGSARRLWPAFHATRAGFD